MRLQIFYESFTVSSSLTKHHFGITDIFTTLCLYKIICYLQRIFNRNRKQQVTMLNALMLGCVQKSNACYIFDTFSSRFAKIQTYIPFTR